MQTSLLSSPPVSGAYRVDISRGSRIGRVSSEWFSRPDDERYLSLPELYHAVKSRAERASTHVVPTEKLRVEACREDGSDLWLISPHQDPDQPRDQGAGADEAGCQLTRRRFARDQLRVGRAKA